jgi:hypothetical protein
MQFMSNGQHISKKYNRVFRGNLGFSSHNAFKKISLSRRDDLISLCYLLTYLLDGQPAWQQGLSEYSLDDLYSITAGIKLAMSPRRLCIGNSRKLLPFVEVVFGYKFKETPDYAKLQFLLKKVLLADEKTPDLVFDWSKNPTRFV